TCCRRPPRLLEAAKSVRVVGTAASGSIDVRIELGSATGTVTQAGHRFRFTIVGGAGYINADQAGLAMFGAPPSVQRQAAGRWLKVPASDFTGLTLASLASQLTGYRGPLESKVRQGTLEGRKWWSSAGGTAGRYTPKTPAPPTRSARN